MSLIRNREINEEQIYLLYNKSREASNIYLPYLESRGLKDFGDVGYVDTFLFDSQLILKSLLLFVRNAKYEITKIISRRMDTGAYDIVWKDSRWLSCYGIYSILDNNLPIVVTESIMDTETLTQNCDFLNSITFATAAISSKERAFLNCVVYRRKVFICYDNDYSGLERMKTLIKQSATFGNSFKILDIPYKDINDFYVRAGKKFFVSYVREKLFL